MRNGETQRALGCLLREYHVGLVGGHVRDLVRGIVQGLVRDLVRGLVWGIGLKGGTKRFWDECH